MAANDEIFQTTNTIHYEWQFPIHMCGLPHDRRYRVISPPILTSQRSITATVGSGLPRAKMALPGKPYRPSEETSAATLGGLKIGDK
jgi:hypothetical protein